VERTSSLAPEAWRPIPPGRDRQLNPLKYLRKSARFEIGAHFLGLLGGLRRLVMVGCEGRDDGRAELVGFGMGHFQRRHLFQMVVQQPGVIDQGLQDQRLAAGQSAALAAHDRAQGELGLAAW